MTAEAMPARPVRNLASMRTTLVAAWPLARVPRVDPAGAQGVERRAVHDQFRRKTKRDPRRETPRQARPISN